MEFPGLGVKSWLCLRHGHSNAGSELHLRPTPQLVAILVLNSLTEARDQTHILTETKSGSTEPPWERHKSLLIVKVVIKIVLQHDVHPFS